MIYEDFHIQGAVPFIGSFEYPLFFDTDKHRIMKDFDDRYVHIRLIKTGVILQFRFDRLPTFRKKAILITSTNKDTAYLFATENPSFEATLHRYACSGREKPSKTAYNGIVKFGGYIKEQHKALQRTLAEADCIITDENLKAIKESLERRSR